MAKVTTSFANWNFNEQHVQQNLVGGDFVGSHTIIICASAPRLHDTAQGSNAGTTTGGQPQARNAPFTGFTNEVPVDHNQEGFAIPLGIVGTVQVQQGRQLQQIFEIGSKRSYILTARNLCSLTLMRVQYHGPSLLRMLYAYYPDGKFGGTNYGNVLKDMSKDDDTSVQKISLDTKFEERLPNILDSPGYDNFFINLSSDLFSQPMGLVMYIKDNVGDDVGAVFFEECLVENHGLGITQDAVVIAEQVSIRCERVVPMRVNVRRRSALFGNSSVLSQEQQKLVTGTAAQVLSGATGGLAGIP